MMDILIMLNLERLLDGVLPYTAVSRHDGDGLGRLA
jgi:hypothetical protein